MLGIVLALVAAVLIGIGISFQRIGLKGTKFSLRLLRSKYWVIGNSIAVLAFLIYYFALTVEKLSIIQPLINTSIVFTVIFGYLFLREKSNKTELLLLLIIFFGVVLLTV